MQRASVDLPQPVSPTRPRVSPRRTSRLTPSTAWTTPARRAAAPTTCTGKYLTTSSSRTSTSLVGWRSAARPARRSREHLRAVEAAGERSVEPFALAPRRSAGSVGSQHADMCGAGAGIVAQRRLLLAADVDDVGAARVVLHPVGR